MTKTKEDPILRRALIRHELKNRTPETRIKSNYPIGEIQIHTIGDYSCYLLSVPESVGPAQVVKATAFEIRDGEGNRIESGEAPPDLPLAETEQNKLRHIITGALFHDSNEDDPPVFDIALTRDTRRQADIMLTITNTDTKNTYIVELDTEKLVK